MIDFFATKMESYTSSETIILIVLCVIILCVVCCCMYRNVSQYDSTKPNRRNRVEYMNEELQVETLLTRDSRNSHIPNVSSIDNITNLHTSTPVTYEISAAEDLPPSYEELNKENIVYLPTNYDYFPPSYVEATTNEYSKYFSKYFT